jgi:hypothetical protein
MHIYLTFYSITIASQAGNDDMLIGIATTKKSCEIHRKTREIKNKTNNIIKCSKNPQVPYQHALYLQTIYYHLTSDIDLFRWFYKW